MLRPDDIRSTTFKKGLFGYKAAEVDSFKDTVFRAYNDLSKDYEETKEKFDKLTKAMEETRLKLFELENQLQQAENVCQHIGCHLLLGIAPRTVRVAMAFHHQSVEAQVHSLLAQRSHQLPSTSNVARVTDNGQIRNTPAQLYRYLPHRQVSVNLLVVA